MSTYRVSPLEGRPYVSRTSSRTGLRRFHAPDAPRRLLGRMGSEDLIVAVVIMVAEDCVIEGKESFGLSYAPLRERARSTHDFVQGSRDGWV